MNMKAMLRNLAVLGVIGVVSTAGASPLTAQENSTNGARSEQVAVADWVITPEMSAAINAHVAKATRIAQQIRMTSGDMDYASYTNLSQALLGASEAGLDAADSARSFKMAMTALRSANAASAPRVTRRGVMPTVITEAVGIGNVNTEFVFYPIVPCRLLDTRASGVRLSAWVPYPVYFDGSNWGNAAGCSFAGVSAQLDGSLSGLTRAALALNLTVTGSTVGGWIAARPVGSTNITSNLNFNAGQDVANMVIVQDSNATSAMFELLASQPTHAVADVLGVFAPPLATALDCVSVDLNGTGTGNVLNNTEFNLMNAAVCPTGYTMASIGCDMGGSNHPAGLALTQVGAAGGGWYACMWRNQTGLTLNGSSFVTTTRCCRSPGR